MAYAAAVRALTLICSIVLDASCEPLRVDELGEMHDRSTWCALKWHVFTTWLEVFV